MERRKCKHCCKFFLDLLLNLFPGTDEGDAIHARHDRSLDNATINMTIDELRSSVVFQLLSFGFGELVGIATVNIQRSRGLLGDSTYDFLHYTDVNVLGLVVLA